MTKLDDIEEHANRTSPYNCFCGCSGTLRKDGKVFDESHVQWLCARLRDAEQSCIRIEEADETFRMADIAR